MWYLDKQTSDRLTVGYHIPCKSTGDDEDVEFVWPLLLMFATSMEATDTLENIVEIGGSERESPRTPNVRSNKNKCVFNKRTIKVCVSCS